MNVADLFNTGVRPAIDAYLKKKSEEVRSYGNYWSASSAGYCMRKNIFERLGVPTTKDSDPRLQRVFEVGHIFHEWAQRITREAGISIAQEVELQDEELMIRGHFDDLILTPKIQVGEVAHETVGGDLILYDYKTAHSKSFHYSKGRPMSYYHRMQLATYMYMLRRYEGKVPATMPEVQSHIEMVHNLTEARILKISKDDLVMEEKQLFWDDNLEAEILDYWQTLNKYWEDKKMPPCTCADHEGAFMSKEAYNPFFYNDEPCSIEWYEQSKTEGKLK